MLNLSDSLVLDATNLGVGKNVVSFNIVGSNPWSIKDTSFPPALVPLTVLTEVFAKVPLPGVITLNCGDKLLNWWFWDTFTLLPPTAFSLVKHNNALLSATLLPLGPLPLSISKK